jgi:signal transduction histidine kinase
VSIRYKTALVFLLTGLIPFLAVGSLVFLDFQTTLRSNAFRHLEALTSLQEDRVNDLIGVYSLGAVYVSEQPALRQAVQEFLHNPASGEQLHQILVGVESGGPYAQTAPFQELAIADVNGRVLESSNTTHINTVIPALPESQIAEIYQDDTGVHLRFSTPMVYDQAVLAKLYLTIDAQGLFAVMSNRTGLGETGETFLVKQLNESTGLFVTPLRFDSSAAFSRKVSLVEVNRPSAQAVLKKDETFTAGAVGYRGQSVVAVTRFLQNAGLGIVGQIDEDEVFGPIRQLATQVVVFAALLILFTVFVSSFMAELFVKPILRLATAAGRLRRGDFTARAKVGTSDEIGQLGHTFNNMAEDLAKQDQAKSDVLALISHQLRTPVTAVKGFVSLVLHDKKRRLSSQETKMLRLAFEENEKLNELITQILDVAHADSGMMELAKRPADLGKLVQKIVKDHQATLRLRQQTITYTPPPAPLVAVVDPEKLGFVIGNLLTNASKYSPAGSKVMVSLGNHQDSCWIRVTDSGLGISNNDQRKLFQKFSRIENPKRETAEGMGLGLYMSKRIVDLHGGELKVISRENHGSSFTIELPIKG